MSIINQEVDPPLSSLGKEWHWNINTQILVIEGNNKNHKYVKLITKESASEGVNLNLKNYIMSKGALSVNYNNVIYTKH